MNRQVEYNSPQQWTTATIQTALSRLRYCFSSDTTPTNRRYVLRASSDGQLDMWLVPSVADKSIAALQQQRFGDYPQVTYQCLDFML